MSSKISKLLLPHEKKLLLDGELKNITHKGSSSIWLDAPSTEFSLVENITNVYRPMGDLELLFLLKHGILPDTQPYQSITEGVAGRIYAEKYLNGKKWVDSCPTTVVEFCIPKELFKTLFEIQHKCEDGCLSIGLGEKGGGGLKLFNASLAKKESSFRIVKVKRKN